MTMATAPSRPSAAPPAAAPKPAAQAKRLGKQILSSSIFKPFWLALGGLAYLVIRLLEPWRRIEVDMLEFERIGHLIANTEQYLRELSLDPEKSRRLPIFVAGPPANRQALDMIKRRVRVLESAPARLFYMLGLRPWIEGTRFDARLAEDFQAEETDFFHSFNSAPPQLRFLPQEEERGRRLLQELGVPEGGRHFCFHARDSAYLAVAHPHQTREQWAYHDFRNGAIANCLPAAEALAAQGMTVLRMGHTVDNPIRTTHPRIIDYAARRGSDFDDIYLISHAKFFLGNTSGVTAIAHCFGVPTAMANLVPIGGWPSWLKSDLFITKKFWSREQDRLLSFRELIAAGADRWHSAAEFEKAGITLIENTAEEILELVLEMNARLDGKWAERPGDQALQDRFRALIPDGRLLKKFPSRLGADFIRKNQNLLD